MIRSHLSPEPETYTYGQYSQYPNYDRYYKYPLYGQHSGDYRVVTDGKYYKPLDYRENYPYRERALDTFTGNYRADYVVRFEDEITSFPRDSYIETYPNYPLPRSYPYPSYPEFGFRPPSTYPYRDFRDDYSIRFPSYQRDYGYAYASKKEEIYPDPVMKEYDSKSRKVIIICTQ